MRPVLVLLRAPPWPPRNRKRPLPPRERICLQNPQASPRSPQIALPKDGRFSAVVVGNALENQYPEIAGAWNGRIAYTAYLHVGLAKSWLLQYSLPRDADASAGGTVARLDAPWPFNIVRPNLAPGSIDADALMIHGFIDESGRFLGLERRLSARLSARPVRARRTPAMAIQARHAGWPTNQSRSAADHSRHRGLNRGLNRVSTGASRRAEKEGCGPEVHTLRAFCFLVSSMWC